VLVVALVALVSSQHIAVYGAKLSDGVVVHHTTRDLKEANTITANEAAVAPFSSQITAIRPARRLAGQQIIPLLIKGVIFIGAHCPLATTLHPTSGCMYPRCVWLASDVCA